MTPQPASAILVISAHAADFCSRSGGTIAIHTHAGTAVHVIDLTFGERGESEDYWTRPNSRSIDDARRVRREEASAAAAILGATIQFFDYGDYPLVMSADRIEAVAHAIRTVRPQMILTHWKHDPYNLDHEVTAAAVLRAASIAAISGFEPENPAVLYPVIYGFEPSIPRDDDCKFLPTHYVPIDEVFELKVRALAELRSQSRLGGMYTQWGEYRGAQARQWSGRPVRYAEAFVRYTAAVCDSLA